MQYACLMIQEQYNGVIIIKNCQIQEVSIVSTRDTVPGGHFDQNISGITKMKFLDLFLIKTYIKSYIKYKQEKIKTFTVEFC